MAELASCMYTEMKKKKDPTASKRHSGWNCLLIFELRLRDVEILEKLLDH